MKSRRKGLSYLVSTVLGPEVVTCESCFVPLDHLEVVPRLWKYPQIAFLVTDAAITFIGSLDFRELDFIHEGFTMAVATVGGELLLLFDGRHGKELQMLATKNAVRRYEPVR
jgi:hypothetical protein